MTSDGNENIKKKPNCKRLTLLISRFLFCSNRRMRQFINILLHSFYLYENILTKRIFAIIMRDTHTCNYLILNGSQNSRSYEGFYRQDSLVDMRILDQGLANSAPRGIGLSEIHSRAHVVDSFL